MARCGKCGHFASVHHGGGGGRPGGSSCAAPDCDCPKFVEGTDARVPLGKDNLTPAEVPQLTGLSVHTLSYWRQTDQGPKTIKAGTRTLYQRRDSAGILSSGSRKSMDGPSPWTAGRMLAPIRHRAGQPVGTRRLSRLLQAGLSQPTRHHGGLRAPTPCYLSIAESLLIGSRRGRQVRTSGSCGAADWRTSHRR
jgi:hypothetical protein